MNFKQIDELSNQTKITIDDLYEKILLRKADSEGMKYFGNLLEQGMTPDEIRNKLLSSDEGKNISVDHPIRSEIKYKIEKLYDRPATYDEINYFHKMIDDGLMKLSELENVLKQTEEYKTKQTK